MGGYHKIVLATATLCLGCRGYDLKSAEDVTTTEPAMSSGPSSPANETDCFDGKDNDRDGLIDCEDGDCFTDCAEDCSDGADNDADGLIDCADDDCLAQSPCNATVRVYGGRMTLVGDSAQDYSHGFFERATVHQHVELYDLYGDVQARSSGGAVVSTCAWSFQRGSFDHTQSHLFTWNGTGGAELTENVGFVQRSGFQLDADCAAFSDSGFLPRRLMVAEQRAVRVNGLDVMALGTAYIPGSLWYDGPVTTGWSSSSTWLAHTEHWGHDKTSYVSLSPLTR